VTREKTLRHILQPTTRWIIERTQYISSSECFVFRFSYLCSNLCDSLCICNIAIIQVIGRIFLTVKLYTCLSRLRMKHLLMFVEHLLLQASEVLERYSLILWRAWWLPQPTNALNICLLVFVCFCNDKFPIWIQNLLHIVLCCRLSFASVVVLCMNCYNVHNLLYFEFNLIYWTGISNW